MALRTREYFRPAGDEGDFIRVRYSTERGTVVRYTVQHEAWIEGEYRPVVRYDNAHGFPHRDVLDWSGETIRKERLVEMSPKEALSAAITDILDHWRELHTEFLRRKP